MISVNLIGGLGNYCFQIAAGLSLAIDNKSNFILPTNNIYSPHQSFNEYFKYSNIYNNSFVSFEKIDFNQYYGYREPAFSYKPIPHKDNIILNGYFQSEKYFKHNKKIIKEIFSPNDGTLNYIKEKYNEFKFDEYCSIHVRRGDYLKYPDIHYNQPIEYYEKAIKSINCNKFLIFSDDISWCKEKFKGSEFLFIENNPAYIDMTIMSMCHSNIITNSSFSWWGAWLNNNLNKKVIAPDIWFGKSAPYDSKDLIPDNWIKI